MTDVVTGLQPDYLYKYRVVAINLAGKEGLAGDGFVTCPSEGPCPSQPYLRGESLWNLEGAERAGNEAPRLEEEREAKKKEEEERPVKEAAERAAKEREAREAGERAGKEAAERERAAERAATTHSPKCVVPHLRGDSLTEARRALGRAHCRMGRLTEPRDYPGSLVVVRQSVRGGSRLAKGTRVALTLSRPEKR
ncbi:MAG TPA: PASTA domain-containing protein [Solirubrobacteraceae bacterium]